MTSRSFRRLFPQLNVQTIPEDEFYRQASLSQLLTGPDEQELASFRPDIKDPLELVEATAELAGMLGSSLEFVDTRYLESSPPPTPPPPASVPSEKRGPTAAVEPPGLEKAEIPAPAGKAETKALASAWEAQQQGSGIPGAAVRANLTINVNVWEQRLANSASKVDSNIWSLQRQKKLTPEHAASANPDPKSSIAAAAAATSEPQRKSNPDSGSSEQSRDDPDNANAAKPESKTDAWQQKPIGNSSRNVPATPDVKVSQRLRCRTAGNSDAAVAPLTGRDSPASVSPAKPPNQTKTSDSTKTSVDGKVWELQRLRSKSAGAADPVKSTATVEISKWEPPRATKREASFCDLGQGAKTIKMDPAWQRSLGNVRVHIRDLGMTVLGGSALHRDLKKEQGKVSGKNVRAKARS